MKNYEWYGDKVIQNVNNARRGGLTAAALIVEGEAVMRCPVDTGNLRASITHDVGEDEAKVGTNVEYAPYVEYEQAFLRTALDNNKSRVEKMIADVMRKAVK